MWSVLPSVSRRNCNYLVKSCELKCCIGREAADSFSYDFKPILPKVNKKM